MRLAATSVSSAVHHVCYHAFRGVVHSVFGRVLNLIADGRLIAVADSSLGFLPNGVAVSLDRGWRFDECGIKPGTCVAAAGNDFIAIGSDLQIWLADAKIVTARKRLSAPLLDPADRIMRLALARELALQSPCDVGLTPLWREWGGEAGPVMDGPSFELCAVARPHLTALVTGLISGRADVVHDASAGLVGLGPGLTPSGDDVLTGIAAVLALVGTTAGVEAELAPLRSGILAGAAGRTNEIAWTYLELATRGEIADRLFDYIAALTTLHAKDLAAATAGLFAVGASSGVELGLGAALGVWAITCRERCPVSGSGE